MGFLAEFPLVLMQTIRDVFPIAAILVFFQFAILRRPLPNPRRLIAGFICVLLGLVLFLIGLEQALFPVGRLMASQFTDPIVLSLLEIFGNFIQYIQDGTPFISPANSRRKSFHSCQAPASGTFGAKRV